MKRHVLATLASIFVTLLLGIGIAVAVEGGGGSTPSASDSASSSHSSSDDESSESDDTESEDASTASDAASAQDTTTEGAGEHPENHGKYVSQAAHDCPTGSDHGPCVSAVAKSDAGKPQK